MTLYKELPLIDVNYNDTKTAAVLDFLNSEEGTLIQMKINTQKYEESSGTYQPDEETAQQAEEVSQNYFGVAFNDLNLAVGTKHDVYQYESENGPFAKPYPVNVVSKFDTSMVDQSVTGKITEVVDNGHSFQIKFDYEGDTYASNFNYSKYVESQHKYFPIAGKKEKAKERFQKKTGMEFEKAIANLPDREAIFTIRKAGKSSAYAELVAVK